ncbi:unnamed protein product [Prorocentrum cordatum]|uniref:Exocyst complex component Sec6 n=1 Tax=Prorocentrum cordatum TaxID=2364126 RepID=A0ABN9SU96_9DINO|nr:unnamed protein product [Polarella glacialis]
MMEPGEVQGCGGAPPPPPTTGGTFGRRGFERLRREATGFEKRLREGCEERGPTPDPKRSRAGPKACVVVKPDGRKCRFCSITDDTPWIVQGDSDHEFWVWGYPPYPSGKNQGNVCWICMRVFCARYEAKGYKISTLVVKMGSDKDINTEFTKYREQLTEMVKQHGMDFPIDWKTFDEVLSTQNESNVRIREPEDQYMEYRDYVGDHGDPATNGLGHERCTFMNKDMVRMPAKKVWRVIRESVDKVVKKKVYNIGDGVGEGQLDANFADMSASLFSSLPRATGVCLDELLSQKKSPTKDSQEPPPGTASADDEDDKLASSSAGIGRMAQMLAPAQKEADAATTAVSKAKPAHSSVPGASTGKRGRPEQPPVPVAEEELKVFKACGPNEKYFEQAQHFRRSLERSLKKIQKLVSDTSEPEEYHLRLQKSLQTMFDVSKAWAVKQIYDDRVHRVLVASVAFLQLAPTTDLPFPIWLMQKSLTHGAEARPGAPLQGRGTAGRPDMFWGFFGDQVMEQSGYEQDSEKRNARIKLLKAKIATLVKSRPKSKEREMMDDLFGIFSVAPDFIKAAFPSDFRFLNVLADPAGESTALSHASFKEFDEKKLDFAGAIADWDTGSGAVEHARSAYEKKVEREKTGARVQTALVDVAKHLDDSDLEKACLALNTVRQQLEQQGESGDEDLGSMQEALKTTGTRLSALVFSTFSTEVTSIMKSGDPSTFVRVQLIGEGETQEEKHETEVDWISEACSVLACEKILPVGDARDRKAAAEGETLVLNIIYLAYMHESVDHQGDDIYPEGEKGQQMALEMLQKMAGSKPSETLALKLTQDCLAELQAHREKWLAGKMIGGAHRCAIKALGDAYKDVSTAIQTYEFRATEASGSLFKDNDARDKLAALLDEDLGHIFAGIARVSNFFQVHHVRQKISFLRKYLDVSRHCAKMEKWLASGEDSPRKIAMTMDSAKSYKVLQDAVTLVNDMANTMRKRASVEDISAALNFHGPEAALVDYFPPSLNLPWAAMLDAVNRQGVAALESTKAAWEGHMQSLRNTLQGALIPWEHVGEKLLTPEAEDVATTLMKNKAYGNVSPLAGSISDMLKVCKFYSDIIPKELAKSSEEVASAGLKLVSVTFTLYHLKVVFPTVKGAKLQTAEKDKLKAQHAASQFKDSWECLPAALKKAVDSFGAKGGAAGAPA